jgi:hypothetical protein
MDLESPPVTAIESEPDAYGKEGQGYVGDHGYAKGNPHPDIFSCIAFCVVTRPVADPAPGLFNHINTMTTRIGGTWYSLQPGPYSVGFRGFVCPQLPL